MKVELTETLEEIVRILGEDARKWIPVSVRIPENTEPVIICRELDGRFVVGMGSCYGRNKWRVFNSNARKVDFWRPLPAPPFEAKQESQRGGA